MKKSGLLISHLLFWVFTIICTPYLFWLIFWMVTHYIQHPQPAAYNEKYELDIDYPALLVITTVGAGIFYASYFSLNFFVRKWSRFIWIFLFYAIWMMVVSLPADFISEQGAHQLGPILYFNMSGFLMRACVEWFSDRKLKAALEKDRDASQLELLKSKIDPHFLFNNLNNIDVFIQEDPERASQYLKKLSDILRFMLYETNINKISLTQEIEYIRKYIDLQKIRTSNANYVKFDIIGETENKKIPPMILIHFIENAFKYSGNKKIEEAVLIRLDVNGDRLSFYCRNHFNHEKQSDPANKGMGIDLLRQKLDLLYKNGYNLLNSEENNYYIVTLEIPLDED